MDDADPTAESRSVSPQLGVLDGEAGAVNVAPADGVNQPLQLVLGAVGGWRMEVGGWWSRPVLQFVQILHTWSYIHTVNP